MTIKQLIAQVRAAMQAKLSERDNHRKVIEGVRAACAEADNRDLTDDEAAKVRAAQESIRGIDSELEEQRSRVAELEDELARDEAADRLSREVNPGASTPRDTQDRAPARVGQEKRTYNPENDRNGIRFLTDVVESFRTGSPGSRERLARHMDEEQVERAGQLVDRATGTGSFSGLVVPQYLVDLVAPIARAGRPFADACRHHDLPAQGMTVDISKITTGSSTDVQGTENTDVDETDMDDTLLQVSVQTNAGQQTVSRQAIERGVGIEDTTLEDLFRAYATTLDGKLLNQATNGLTNVATAITYTSASPTASELYPKLLEGPAAVEAALLDMDPGDGIAVMHSRRWYWLQSQLASTWPLFGQPGVPAQLSGVNFGEKYGAGFRGVLPSGQAVIVDNNIATNTGAGTNQDEIYFGAQSELHLWEDPSAPMLIRAEQTKAASLGVLLVVYGYFAYTFARRSHAQKISGTGLVTPSF